MYPNLISIEKHGEMFKIIGEGYSFYALPDDDLEILFEKISDKKRKKGEKK